MAKKSLTKDQSKELFTVLKTRFEKNMLRHKDVTWNQVAAKLEAANAKLWSLYQMEITGGEPDLIGLDARSGDYLFIDCSPESPKERRSICYDQEALNSRKEFKPNNSAIGLAAEMGIALLTEQEYRQLQELGNFDCKTSSWVATPAKIRNLGGALFCDRRYNTVFTYHNGAESYYAGRAFRGMLRV